MNSRDFSLRKTLKRFGSESLNGPQLAMPDASAAERRRILEVIMWVAVVILVVVGLIQFPAGYARIGWFDLSLALLFYPLIRMVRSGRNQILVETLILLVIIPLYLTLLVDGGIGKSGIFWLFTYPLFAFVFKGKFGGWVWTVGFLMLVGAMVGLREAGLMTLAFDNDTLTYFAVSYLFVAMFAQLTEWSRDRHHSRLQEANQVLGREVERRRIAEEGHRLAEERLTRCLDGSRIGVWDAQSSHGEVFVSPSFRELVGISGNQPLTFDEMKGWLHPAERESVIAHIFGEGLGSGPFSLEHRLRHPDGDYFWVMHRGRVERDPSGSLIRASGSLIDIGELVHTRTDLGQALQKAEESGRLKSEFVANVSHEIRTPLMGVLGMAELILDTELTAQQRHQIEAIGTSARTLRRILDDILDFSRLENRGVELVEAPFDPRRLVWESARLMIPRRPKLRYGIYIDPEIPMQLLGDRDRLAQVLGNLIGNAAKFTPEGAIHISLTREEDEKGGWIKSMVCDTGIGISEQVQHLLFQPFSQVSGEAARLHGGSGLGLAISRRLVEAMGGEIGVESREGEGACFWLRLPLEEPPKGENLRHALGGRRILRLGDACAEGEQAWRAWEVDCLSEGASEGFDAVVAVEETVPSDPVQWRQERLGGGKDPSIPVLMIVPPWPGDRLPWHLLEGGIEAVLPAGVPMRGFGRTLAGILPSQPVADDRSGVVRRHLRVLLVEDQPISREVLTMQLQKLGVEVESAVNGEEACTRFAERPFDLVLMDLQMPGIDGFRATKRMRILEERTGIHTPIIALSASALSEDRQRSMNAGMDGFLGKPVETQDLRRLIDEYCPEVGE
ncbi:MAG: hypothetical protein AUJ55_03765 [Proteobacteria bacterium CG1_02_64_396]|nr:MAG: hypothetical protein AUJ55_03765 [Proteobacteria bacterium CG1_02_64_396]